jgi:hypothetical protein
MAKLMENSSIHPFPGIATAVREVVARYSDWALPPATFVTSVLYPPGKVLADLYGSV